MQHTFLYISLLLFCTTKTWNFLVIARAHQKFCCLCSCSLLIFSLPLIFTWLAASISHFLTAAMTFSCFSCNEISLLCLQSLAPALSLLSTRGYTSKITSKKTRLCCCFSLLQSGRLCDLLPNKTLSCIWVATPVDWVILHWYACGGEL